MSTRMSAVVTGASSGIGRELARCCVERGMDVLLVADEEAVHASAEALDGRNGGAASGIVADLSINDGIDAVMRRIGARPVDVLIANAGRSSKGAFLDLPWSEIERIIDTNILGELDLIHRLGGAMGARGSGRILITGSIAGYIPGGYQAIYNASKAFMNSFAFALNAELEHSGVTVTCLMPGPTETLFFRRAGLLDTGLARMAKDDPADVAKAGIDALFDGEAMIITGWQNKLQAALARIAPQAILARQYARMAKPGSADKQERVQ